MAKDTGGFSFKIETSVAVPERTGGGGGAPKYDWSQFPAPTKEQLDAKTPPSALIKGVKNAKTFYKSIDRYKEKLKEAGVKDKDLPEFKIAAEKDKAGQLVGYRIFRMK